MTNKKDFFENDDILQEYLAFRHSPESPNESSEKPAFLELLGDIENKHILDLGCGDAKFGVELLEAGCASYFGIEPSQKMPELAQQNLSSKGSVEHSTIEAWKYPPEIFDVVISRLVLHYVEDYDKAFRDIYKTLKPDGRLVFSMVHPVITSSDKSRENNELRTSWIVDDYVTQYHRTLESILMSLQEARLGLEGLREGYPKLENFKDKDLYERRLRIPLFLILSVKKQVVPSA